MCIFKFDDFDRVHSTRSARRWLLAGILMLAFGLAACNKPESETLPSRQEADMQTTETATQSTPPVKATKKAMEEKIAVANGREITRHMLRVYSLTSGTKGFSEVDIATKKAADLRPLIEALAADALMQEKINAMDPESTYSLQAQNDALNKSLQSALQEQEVWDKATDPTDAEIEKFYTENSTTFKDPFRFSMRFIVVANYKPVVSKAGDSLESLTGGDANRIRGILIDGDLKVPRAPKYGMPEGLQTVKPLEPGEYLLIPVSEEERKTNLAKIEAARKRILAGADFGMVADEVSDSAIKGKIVEDLPLSGRPPLPEIMEMAKKLPVGKVSDVFRTKHGFMMMKIESKKEAGIKPLADAREEVIERLGSKRIKERSEAFIESLFMDRDLLEIDMKKIADASMPNDAVVATVGDQTFTRGDFKPETLQLLNANTPEEGIRKSIVETPKIRAALLIKKALDMGLDKSDRVFAAKTGFMSMGNRNAYLGMLRSKMKKECDDPKYAKSFFESNPELFALPRYFTYSLVAVDIEDAKTTDTALRTKNEKAAIEKIRELLKGVDTLEKFEKIAKEKSTFSKALDAEGVMAHAPQDSISPDLAAAMASLGLKKTTDPMLVMDKIVVAWPIKIEEPRPMTIEEAKDNLSLLVFNVRMKDFEKNEMLKVKDSLQIELQ
jgi:parvulin-like peptidyl-prolyl isomerase